MDNSQPSAFPQIPPLDVGLLENHEESRWKCFVENQPDATFYHSLCWRDVTVDGLGHEPFYLRACDQDGQILGVLPMFLVTGLFGRRLVSVPMRDRGGLLTRHLEVGRALLSAADRLARDLDCSYLEVKSLDPLPNVLREEFGFVEDLSWINSRVDLSPGETAIWDSLDKDSVRWAVRKARKEGVRVEIDNSESAAERFHELFVRTRTSVGIPPYSRRFFRALWQHVIRAGHGNLFVASVDGEPINAMINLLESDTVIAAYAAPQPGYRQYNPSDVVIWETIAWSCQQGYQVLDFGADSDSQEGLLWFKRKWGSSQKPNRYMYLLYGRDQPPNMDSSSASFQLARSVWQILPHGLASALGGLVCEQLS